MGKKELNLRVANWYALRTRPKSERMVGKRLEMESVVHYIPCAGIKRRWSDRVKKLDTPLLENIVLVNCRRLRLRYLCSVKGVLGVVKRGELPLVISPESIEALRVMEGVADGSFLVGVDVIDSVMGLKWDKRGSEVVKVDEDHYYLFIPELDVTICTENK